MVLVAVAWTVLAAPAGLLMGRGMQLADRRDEARQKQSPVPDFIPDEILVAVAQRHQRD